MSEERKLGEEIVSPKKGKIEEAEGINSNAENLTTKYIDKELNFSFYYLKSFEISESKPSEYFPKGDIYLTKVGPSDETIIITKYIGQRVEDSDAKFGRIAYYYDEDKKQWMKDEDTDYESGVSPADLVFIPYQDYLFFFGHRSLGNTDCSTFCG